MVINHTNQSNNKILHWYLSCRVFPIFYRLNEYCLANYENEWYRAKVVEIMLEDKFLVVYIDFTNEMELASKSIRRYPMSLNLPCCTTLCSIDGGFLIFILMKCINYFFLLRFAWRFIWRNDKMPGMQYCWFLCIKHWQCSYRKWYSIYKI